MLVYSVGSENTDAQIKQRVEEDGFLCLGFSVWSCLRTRQVALVS